jgi:pimeloyl-ACP methyl ester carboxylesterase
LKETHAVVLVHGAFHGPWCWETVRPHIEALGARCVAPELHRGGLEADAAAVQTQVDALHAEGLAVVAVGHSLGCSTVAALDPANVAHVVFLAGPLAAPGLPEPQSGVAPGFFEAVTFRDDGTMTIDRERAIGLFYADCATDVAREAASRLRPNVVYGPTPTSDPPIWQATASTYLWCDDDATVLADYQHRLAQVCRFSEGFASSHSPMLSQPQRLAEAIGRVLERTPPSAT